MLRWAKGLPLGSPVVPITPLHGRSYTPHAPAVGRPGSGGGESYIVGRAAPRQAVLASRASREPRTSIVAAPSHIFCPVGSVDTGGDGVVVFRYAMRRYVANAGLYSTDALSGMGWRTEKWQNKAYSQCEIDLSDNPNCHQYRRWDACKYLYIGNNHLFAS